MTVDEQIDDVGRKGKKSRAGQMSVAQRLQSHAQLSPNSIADSDDKDRETIQKLDLNLGKYDKATIRIIAQFLDNIGLKNSVEALVEETGFTIETSAGARIRSNILRGNYDVACSILKQARDLPHETASNASYIIQCFKLADLVRKRRYFDALFTMQSMAPHVFRDETKNLEYFDSFVKDVMLGETRYLHTDAITERNSQLTFLEEMLPSDFILPQNRLRNLLHKMHGPASDEKASKLVRDDSGSGLKSRPYRSLQVWEHHTTPVYSVKFSRNGKLLASGGKSNAVSIWKVNNGRITRLGDLAPITEGEISYMEFCQKGRFLALCGASACKYINLTIFEVPSRSVYRTLRVHGGHDDIVDITSFFTCCSFLTSPTCSMIVAGNELGALKIYNLNMHEEAPPVKQVSGFRVRAIYGMNDGDQFLTVDAHNRVRLYALSTDMTGTTICKEEVTILNMTVHPSEKLVLTTTDYNLRLWDIRTHNLIRVFSGACQREEFARYSIHATFGGVHQNFIATGTIGKETEESLRLNQKRLKKNGRVVIWSVEESRPKFTLVGHRGHVNCVAWNPRDPTMIVSCGDDTTVRVWNLSRAETADYSEIIPRQISRRQKYKTADTNVASTSKNGTTDLIKSIQELLATRTGFALDADLELEWIKKAQRPNWKTTDG